MELACSLPAAPRASAPTAGCIACRLDIRLAARLPAARVRVSARVPSPLTVIHMIFTLRRAEHIGRRRGLCGEGLLAD